MKDVPFYTNHEDGMHSMSAVYRSIFEYFGHRKLSWDELEKISGYRHKRAAWSLTMLTYMAAHGFDIRMIDPFDYRRFLKEGDAYVDELYSPEERDWIYAHSNIRKIRPLIPPFLAQVTPEHRSPQLEDIDQMLDDGRLVFVSLNADALNHREGFSSHAILIIGRDGDFYIAHDPGDELTPPQPNLHIPRQTLWEAMGGQNNRQEVTGFKPGVSQAKKRLDVFVAEQLPSISRAFAAKLCEQGKVTVNGRPAKPGHRLRKEDDVRIDYTEADLQAIPHIDLPVIYEDDDTIVINKPAGVLTHAQGALSTEATVASFFRDKLQGTGLSGNRAGIVHRLDRATSGVIICAKHAAGLSFLQKQFADRTVVKTYTAIVRGHLAQPEAIIDMPIERNPKAPATFRVGANGKPAITHYTVLQTSPRASLLELQPRTGRTHQLRVHLAQVGHPIVGDPLYGDGKHGGRLFLHAHKLTLKLLSGDTRTFTAPLPPEFKEYMR